MFLRTFDKPKNLLIQLNRASSFANTQGQTIVSRVMAFSYKSSYADKVCF